MPRVNSQDIEETEEFLPRVISMRRKVALCTFAFMFSVGAILLASSPGIEESYTALMGIRDFSGESSPTEVPPNEGDPAETITRVGGYFIAELPIGQYPDDGYETTIFDDYFDGEHAWNARQRKFTIRDGYVFLNISANMYDYACMIVRDEYLTYAGVETRLRASSPAVPMLAIGFHGEESVTQFMWFSNESKEGARGLHAFCKVKGLATFWEPIELDVTEWHTYKVIWQPDNATFIVDGEVVAQTDQVPDSYQEVCIYNNCKASVNPSLILGNPAPCSILKSLKVSEDQFTQIDYIRIFDVLGDGY